MYNHLLETNEESPKLTHLKEADPNFEYLKALHWDYQVTSASPEAQWLASWLVGTRVTALESSGVSLGVNSRSGATNGTRGPGVKLLVPRPSLPEDKEGSEQEPAAPSDNSQEYTVAHVNTGSVGEQDASNNPPPAQRGLVVTMPNESANTSNNLSTVACITGSYPNVAALIATSNFFKNPKDELQPSQRQTAAKISTPTQPVSQLPIAILDQS